MRTDEGGNSARLAMWYKDVPLSLEILKMLEGKVTNECWKYFLGKFCLAEKNRRCENEQIKEIYRRIGEDFGFTYTNMKDYIDYAHAIDKIHGLLPHVSEEILNGESRIGQKATVMFSKLNLREMGEVMARISHEKAPVKLIIAEQKELRTKTKRPGRPKLIKNETPRVSVKDNPVYDPDAHINAITYTISSWINTIERAFTVSKLGEVSPNAQDRLLAGLNKLTDAVGAVMVRITEET